MTQNHKLLFNIFSKKMLKMLKSNLKNSIRWSKMELSCQYCNKIVATKGSLKTHQQKTKYCLKLQNVEAETLYSCTSCTKTFTVKSSYDRHLFRHMQDPNTIKLKNEIEELKIMHSNERIKNALEKVKFLQNHIINLSTKVVESSKNKSDNLSHIPTFEDETVIEIEYEDEKNAIEDEEKKEDKSGYKNMTLELTKEFCIENRQEDGYINVTNLCKAGGKQFKHWNSSEKNKAFLRVLSVMVGIQTIKLIKMSKGGNGERHTWVHPQVAINIAQWISPYFDVKVSAWIYEVMMTGRVDITNTKSYRQLQEENNNKELKIQYLTKKYVKKQSRQEFEERYVVYILTTPSLKKDRRYILGKAENLTNRLSTYNKTDEHEVVYYQTCGDEDNMRTVENLVFQKLKEYREQANRERFVLPEDKDVNLFIDIVKKSIEFLSI